MEYKKFIDTQVEQEFYEKHFIDAIDKKKNFVMEALLDWMLYIPSSKVQEKLQNLALENPSIPRIQEIVQKAHQNQALALDPNEFFLKHFRLKNYNLADKITHYVNPTQELILEVKKAQTEHKIELKHLLKEGNLLNYSFSVKDPDITNAYIKSEVSSSIVYSLLQTQFREALETKDFKAISKMHDNGFVPDLNLYEYNGKLKHFSSEEKEIMGFMFMTWSPSKEYDKPPVYDYTDCTNDPIKKLQEDLKNDVIPKKNDNFLSM